MAKNALKRVISEPEDEAMKGQGHRKKARKNTVSEDVVKEFLKLTGVKQTRLKGMNRNNFGYLKYFRFLLNRDYIAHPHSTKTSGGGVVCLQYMRYMR